MRPIARRADGRTELPLSLLQRRMWYVCTAYEGTASPIVYLTHRLRGHLDEAAFAAAVSEVADRHEALRTTFRIGPDGPRQVIAAPSGIETEIVDVRGHADPEAAAVALVAEMTGALLDLDGGPLTRSRLIRLADDHHVWCFTVHHILADGTSAQVVDAEVAACYRAAVTGEPSGLAPVPIGYGDFALWQTSAEGATTDEALRYWVKQLSGCPPLAYPTDWPRPAVKNTRTDQVDLRLDAELTTGLERLARTERATLFMVLLAAFAAVLSRGCGQQDFCLGTPVSGRTLVETEEVVGLFNNMLALRHDLSGDPTFRQLLGRVKATAIEALARQDVPFGQIVNELGLPHDPGRTQVFQVIFSLHTESGLGARLPGLDREPFGVGNPQAIHDMMLDAWRGPTGLAVSLRYDTGLFASATMAALAQQFAATLGVVLADPDRHLGEI